MTAAELRALIAGAEELPPYTVSPTARPEQSLLVRGDSYRASTQLPTGVANLIAGVVNNAERFAELLRREEAAVVASGATTEPVSDPYKLHWAWYGNDHVYLTAELEIVGVVHLPQSGSCIEYPWRCGSVVGTALCIGDARAAVEDAVRAGR